MLTVRDDGVGRSEDEQRRCPQPMAERVPHKRILILAREPTRHNHKLELRRRPTRPGLRKDRVSAWVFDKRDKERGHGPAHAEPADPIERALLDQDSAQEGERLGHAPEVPGLLVVVLGVPPAARGLLGGHWLVGDERRAGAVVGRKVEQGGAECRVVNHMRLQAG